MKSLFVSLSLLILIGCAGHNSNVLVNRGVPPEERPYEVNQEGYGVPKKVKRSFLAGYIIEGMNQTLVRFLWGPPDRSNEDNSIWEYTTSGGKLITRLHFVKSDKPILDHYPLVIETIDGDRWGGSPPPSKKS